MSLYFLILLLSVSVPFVLSFDRKVQFYRLWKYIFPSIIITAGVFILVDIVFTRNGIWGFNPRYLQGINLAGLPVEEWLFFILIPYSCLFIHYVYLYYSGNYTLSDKSVRWISGILILILAIISVYYAKKTYTLYYSFFAMLILVLALFDRNRTLNSLFISFLIMLVPFIIVNAILTGTFIEDEVVWYSSKEIMGFRILTIPVEDFWYSFSLVAMNLIITEKFRMRGSKS